MRPATASTDDQPRHRTVAALVVVLVATLWAGLHPFSFLEPNDVGWDASAAGLRFGPHSIAHTDSEFRWDTSSASAQVGIELWLEQGATDRVTADVLTVLDDLELPVLRLSRVGADLVVRSRVTNESNGDRWSNEFTFPGVLAPGARHHLALMSAAPFPRLVVDGDEVRRESGYGIPLGRKGRPFAGRLVIGADPGALASWSGVVHALVVHERGPAAAELDARASLPIRDAIDAASASPSVVAAWDFTRRVELPGHVRDLGPGGHDLLVPSAFAPTGVPLLGVASSSPLTSARMFGDAALNVLGFVPLGLALALFIGRRGAGAWLRVAVIALAVCAAVSLLVEVAQSRMPTRHSSRLDLALNTLGGVLGAAAVGVSRARGARPPST
jgi:VanZ family protein